MRRKNRIFFPVVLVFIILNALFIVFRNMLERKGFDTDVLITANLLLFILCIAGIYLQQKGLASTGTPAFLRSVYSAMMLKMFILMIVFFIYAWAVVNINQPALFASMGLYVVYTAFEVSILMSVARKQKHA